MLGLLEMDGLGVMSYPVKGRLFFSSSEEGILREGKIGSNGREMQKRWVLNSGRASFRLFESCTPSMEIASRVELVLSLMLSLWLCPELEVGEEVEALPFFWQGGPGHAER
jgi:hypothetical protein